MQRGKRAPRGSNLRKGDSPQTGITKRHATAAKRSNHSITAGEPGEPADRMTIGMRASKRSNHSELAPHHTHRNDNGPAGRKAVEPLCNRG